jgi:hypothetical protein
MSLLSRLSVIPLLELIRLERKISAKMTFCNGYHIENKRKKALNDGVEQEEKGC